MARRARDRASGSPASRWLAALGQGLVALLGLLLLAAGGGLLLATQTAAGRGAAARFVEDAVAGAVAGGVTVGPITGGNLFTRAELERFRITGPDGGPFLTLEDVRVSYSPLGFLTGEIHLRRLEAGRLELHLRQSPDGAWNFDRIFGGAEPDTAPSDPSGGIRLLATDAAVREGLVEVRTPWARDLAGAARDSAEAAAMAGEGVWRFERGEDGGVERVLAVEGMSGRLPFLRLADPGEPMRLELQDVTGLARVVRQPITVRELDAAVTFGDPIVVALERMRTEGSELSGRGEVTPADPPRFRFDLDADRMAFPELAWLPVPVPRSGGGTGDLVVRSRERDPETLVVEIADADFRSGESRATGSFVLHLEDPPRFEGVDLRLRPLRLALAQDLLGQEGLPDGRVEGRVSGAGPVDLFRMDADVTLARLPAGAGPGREGAGAPRPGDAGRDTPVAGADTAGRGGGAAPAAVPSPPAAPSGPSVLRMQGGIGLVGEPRALRELHLEFARFEPRWTRLVGLDTRQGGRVEGTATLDRVPGGRVAFSADLVHRVPRDTTSRVAGQGSIEGDSVPAVDVRFDVDPLSLSVLDPYFPAADLVGVVRGSGSARGTLSDLGAEADLRTPRGEIGFDGSFDLAADRKSYDARLTARGIQLEQWMRGGPETDLDVTGRVRGRGTDPATLQATFDLEILPSVVEEARVDSSLLRFSVEGGLARVDTFAIKADVGTLRGRGGFGLASDRSAALLLNLDAPDLSRWNRWLVPGRGGAPSDTATGDLFALFPEEDEAARGEEDRAAPPDTLAGSLAAQGAAFGNVEDFGVGGHLTVRSVSYGPVTGDSVRMVLDATSARSLDSLVLSGGGRGLGWGDQSVDSLAFRLQRTGSRTGALELRARRPGGSVAARTGVEWSADRKALDLESLEIGVGAKTLTMAGPATVVYADSGLAVDGFVLEGDRGVRFRADGGVPREGEADLDVGVEGLGITGVRRFLDAETEVSGRVGASLRVRGTAAAPRMEATVRVDSPGVAAHRFATLEAEARYADRRVELASSLRSGAGRLARVEGSVRVDLSLQRVERRLLEDPLDLRFTADSLPLELLLAPLESVREVEGHLRARTRISGSPDAPSLDGRGEVRGGSMAVVPLDVELRAIRAGMTFRGSEIRVDSLSLTSGEEGSGSVTGSVGIATPLDPSFDLALRARRLRIVDRRKMSVVADGDGHLGGSYTRPTLSGRFRLSNGTVRGEDFMRSDEVVDLTDPELYALVDTTAFMEQRLLARIRNPFMQNLRADVDVVLGPDLWLRATDLAVELSGEVDVRMDRAQSDVTVFGDVRLARGNYRWTASGVSGLVLSRQLRITEGEIEFVGTPGMNPNLDITATHRVRAELGTIEVRANITGTLAEPQLALSSEPPLSESDQLCVLLMNAPCSAGAAGQLGPQLIGRVGTELTSLLSGGGGPDYLTVQSGAGARTRGQAGLGEVNGDDDTSLFADKELELGWYVSPELFVTVTQPLGNRFPAGSLDWRFAEAWSLEFRSEHRFTQEFARSATSNLDTDRLWGLFLFREWSF